MPAELLELPEGLNQTVWNRLPDFFRAEVVVLLKALLDETRDGFHLRELWLFGSCARGESHQNSDLDLLALIDDSCSNSHPTLQARRAVVNSPVCLNYDLLVLRFQQWLKDQDNPCTCFPEIKSDRILLYAR